MSRLILGVDEAGRGPVVGPMVVAGVLMDERATRELARLGVKDSKLLSREKRRLLAPEIERIASKYTVVTVPVVDVDASVMRRARLWKLNYLEAQTMAGIITQTRPQIAFVDSCDVKPERFADTIRSCLPRSLTGVEIISEHKADRKYPIVAAASILAKVRRDEQIDDLRAKYGLPGSGYAHDARTVGFLTKWYRDKATFPEFVRRSWKTASRVRALVEQRKLSDFRSNNNKRARNRK